MNNNFIILLDNGHGIETPGKRSPDGKFREYLYAREIVDDIVLILTAYKFNAKKLVPEESDISLKERAERVNQYCSKYGKENVILVSVHVNAAGSEGKWTKARGWSVYTTPGKTKSDELATCIYDSAEEMLKNWGYRDTFNKEDDPKQKPLRYDLSDGDPDLEANFYILKYTNCPAVLTENLFMDNKKDVAFLVSEKGRQAIVDTHVNGIIKYYGEVAGLL